MAKKAKKSARTAQQSRQGFVSTKVEPPDTPDYVVVELRYESPIAYTTSRFVAPQSSAPDADSLNSVLEKFDIAAVRSHFGLKAPEVRARLEVAAALPPEPEPLRFSGTSSASPIVTGSVACLQGRAKAKHGAPMTPAKVRNILVATGTPQEPGPGVPLTQHIGPLPNLPKAMKKV